MAIEFATPQPIEWPKRFRATVESQFYPQVSSLFSESALSAQPVYYGPQKTEFLCKMTMPQMRGPVWRDLSGFLAQLKGPTNTVRLVDYHRMRCGYDVEVEPSVVNWSDGSTWDDGRGWANGFLPPFVTIDESALIDSDSIVIRFPADYADLVRVLRLGDLVEVRPNGMKAWHAHLYETKYECRLDASARTRLYFEPGLRFGVAAGDMLVLRWPSSVFRMVQGQDAAFNRTAPGNLANIGLSFRECLP